MGLADSIRNYFDKHPRAKKVLGVASVIASNFALIGSGSAVLAVAAGSIMKHQDDKEKIKSKELTGFLKDAIQDPAVRESIKEAVREGGLSVAVPVSTAMNQLSAGQPESGQYVDTMKSEIAVIAREIGIIHDMVAYYEIPDSQDRVKNVWRLPIYIDQVLVIDDTLRAVLDMAIKHVEEGKNLVILGAPGSGKTTAMYAIWKELNEESDTALVWDTKDVSRVHEKAGIVLFSDDIPETRELVKAIIEKDVSGIVTTAREQDWARLPVELRAKFTSVTLPRLADEAMQQIAVKHLESQNVKYDDKALRMLVEYAQGSPIYVRYMAEEIGIESKTGGIKSLTTTRVRKAPKGMTDYVAGILARVLFDLDGTIYTPKDGAIPVIKALLCLADMPNYETHEVHLNQIFFKVKSPTDAPGPFNAIKQYLSRDPRFYSLKFMHDTLADVLRGKVDHPIVGDIRMLAQEMGAKGRRDFERMALSDGWDHVKAEYDIDPASGLEPLLAYGYFAAKNFGIDDLDQLVVDLANEHMENSLSQGLFAITGPITQIAASETTPPKTILPHSESLAPKTLASPSGSDASSLGGIQKALKESGVELTGSTLEEVERGLAKLGELTDAEGGFGASISRLVETKLSEAGIEEIAGKDRFELLEEIMNQESVSPAKLSRSLRRASTRAKVLRDRGKLSEPKEKGELFTKAAERLVLLDSMVYLGILNHIADGLSATIGESKTARTLSKITGEIAVSRLDEKSQKSIISFFDSRAKQSEKIGDYDAMREHIFGKWNLFGIDSKDLDFASSKLGKLMKLGRPFDALDIVAKINEYFGEDQIEHQIGMVQQAFKNVSRAIVDDRKELEKVIMRCSEQLTSSVELLESKGLVSKNESLAVVCTTLLTSIVKFMDNFVKKSGKSVAAEAAYPLLHETAKPLVMETLGVLKQVGISKHMNTALGTLKKIMGDSSHKEDMIRVAQTRL
ncbi:MAG: ATP-binding cassette domain-containing protein [Promethearchaeota archaeon]